jgi:hypothetical protein
MIRPALVLWMALAISLALALSEYVLVIGSR